MVKAEELENRGVKVMDVHRLLHGAQAVFIGGSMDDAGLQAILDDTARPSDPSS